MDYRNHQIDCSDWQLFIFVSRTCRAISHKYCLHKITSIFNKDYQNEYF